MTLSLTIPGRPVPKKNNPVMIKSRNLILPSKAYREYHKFCIGTRSRPGWLILHYGNRRIDDPCELIADYYLPDYRWFPDVTGLLQASCDLLQDAGIVWNDNQIWSIHGGIAGIDKANPRAELQLHISTPIWWRK